MNTEIKIQTIYIHTIKSYLDVTSTAKNLTSLLNAKRHLLKEESCLKPHLYNTSL